MQENVHRYRIKLTKLNELKFISHLDWQNLILKTLKRTGVKQALSEGFNPTPKISFSSALPLFIESECELVNFVTFEELPPNFIELFHKNTSKNVRILDLYKYKSSQKKPEPLDILIQWARYEAKTTKGIPKTEDLEYNINKYLLSDGLFIKKINKKGIEKNIDYKNSVNSVELIDDVVVFTLKTGQGEIPSLRADEFLKAVFGDETIFKIKRTHFLNRELQVL